MTWAYRIVRYLDDDLSPAYGLHEVYYDADGQPWAMSESRATFDGETPAEVLADLGRAWNSATINAVFDEPEVWPGRNPGGEADR